MTMTIYSDCSNETPEREIPVEDEAEPCCLLAPRCRHNRPEGGQRLADEASDLALQLSRRVEDAIGERLDLGGAVDQEELVAIGAAEIRNLVWIILRERDGAFACSHNMRVQNQKLQTQYREVLLQLGSTRTLREARELLANAETNYETEARYSRELEIKIETLQAERDHALAVAKKIVRRYA